MSKFRSASLTDVGRKRDHNEDSFLVNEELGLYVVCDGMGGHAGGETASRLAVLTIERELISARLRPDDPFASEAPLAESPLKDMASRVEVSGETVFFYTQQAGPLLQALGAHGGLRTLHRPANLEDLFLKLTGRQIREEG